MRQLKNASMTASVKNPVKCKVRSAMRFLHAKRKRPAEFHKEFFSVVGNIMNRQNVTK